MSDEVRWITDADLWAALGVPPSADPDIAWSHTAVAAANQWAWRRRYAAGWTDAPDVAPGPDVRAGTVLLAMTIYRARGGLDGRASFDAWPSTGDRGNYGQVMRLLGIDRPVAA